MFKKIDKKENVSSFTQLKSSAVRHLSNQISTQMTPMTPFLSQVLPKKVPIHQAKCFEFNILYVIADVPIFLQLESDKSDLIVPSLRILHIYPDILPRVQVDRGAIKFVLKGADIMCPGLTSPGGELPVDLPAKTLVAIHAQGKENALAIGILLMSTMEIKSINKGIAIQNVHYLNDGIWTY